MCLFFNRLLVWRNGDSQEKSMNTLPTVSIITAVYNAASTIRECIRSVESQNHFFEHIIVDGGSTDGTLGIIEQCQHEKLDVFSESDRGMYDALNKGISRSQGHIVGALNADDCYEDSEVLRDVATSLSSAQASYGDLLYVSGPNSDKVDRHWSAGSYSRNSFWHGWMPPHPTFFLRSECYQRYGGYRLDLGTAADYELMLRMLVKHKLDPHYIPRVLVRMRTGGISNSSLASRIAANRMDRKSWVVNGLQPYPWTLWFKPIRKVGQFLLR